jgi:microcystin-dependent protein
MTTPVQDSQNFVPVTPDLNAWIRLMFQTFSANFNCVSLATVNSFNAINQTVNLTINYIRVFKNANPNLPEAAADGQTSNVYLPYPVLIQCPVFILQGGGSYLTFPIKAGDTGVVLFNDREISTWMQTGQITYPQNPRTHDLSDGIYFGGIRNILNAIQNYNTSVCSLTDSTGERLEISGTGKVYFGSTLPSGYLWCDGTSYSTTTYPNLFAAIGYTFGGSGGSFNVPNMAGQVPVGIGGTLGLTLGQEFGEVNHTLTIPEMPSHNHAFATLSNPGASSEDVFFRNGGDDQVTQNTGGDEPHNNVQPSLGVNWIIKI